MTDPLTEVQIRVAAALGIDVSRDSRNVASARIHDAVAEAIGDHYGPRPATEKQVVYAQGLGVDVRRETVRVASARIADELDSRNRAALERLKLKPGDRIIKHQTVEINGQRHDLTEEFTISSIHPSGRLFFKGGNGCGAWATQVEKL